MGRTAAGPLHVPRERQGSGRHDAPASYGALYCSQQAVSAVSEAIQFFRGHSLTTADLSRPGGRVAALATLDLAEGLSLVDLDDPQSLVERRLRPSRVATGERDVSQQIARGVYSEGAAGLSWWSTIEASWTNLTLFDERCRRALAVAGRPVLLTTKTPELLAAAERLGIAVE
jgi:hypothetical protein